MNPLQFAGIKATRGLSGLPISSQGEVGFVDLASAAYHSAGDVQQGKKPYASPGIRPVGSTQEQAEDLPDWAMCVFEPAKGCTAGTVVHYKPGANILHLGHHKKETSKSAVKPISVYRQVYQQPELFHYVIASPVVDEQSHFEVVDEIVSLVSGWDGAGGVAPTSEAKRTTVEVAAYLRPYMSWAEVEVDPSDGGVALRWFDVNDQGLVSVDIRPSGKVVVTGAFVDGRGTRKTFGPTELHRVPRAVVDAGLAHFVDRVR